MRLSHISDTSSILWSTWPIERSKKNIQGVSDGSFDIFNKVAVSHNIETLIYESPKLVMKRKLRKYNAYYDPDIKHVAEIDLFINLIGTQVKKMIGIWNGTAIFLGVIEPNPIIDF